MNRDDYAEASALTQWEDPDAIYFAAWCATSDWRKKIEPFQATKCVHLSNELESIGWRLLAPWRPEPKPASGDGRRALEAAIGAIAARVATVRAWHADRVDGTPSGW